MRSYGGNVLTLAVQHLLFYSGTSAVITTFFGLPKVPYHHQADFLVEVAIKL